MHIAFTFLFLWLAAVTAAFFDGGLNESYPKAVSVLNMHKSDVRLRIVDNFLSPPSEIIGDQVVSPGDNATFRVSHGWNGNVQFLDAQYWGWNGNEALVEAAFDPTQGILANPRMTSRTGWTLPMVCGCEEEVRPVIGCNLDLKKLNGGKCDDRLDDGHGSCVNPARGDTYLQKEPRFFTPCRTSAYVIESNHAEALNDGKCKWASTILCCVGSECEPSMKQR